MSSSSSSSLPSVDVCSLREELAQRSAQIQQLSAKLAAMDVHSAIPGETQAELAESERVREQQHQQLLLLGTARNGETGETGETVETEEVERLRVGEAEGSEA